MNRSEIIALQTHIGAVADGFWGPRSIAGCKAFLKNLMPRDSPWPKPDPASLRKFYGEPGNVDQLVAIDVSGLGVFYEAQPVRSIRAHRLVADSLLRILTAIHAASALRPVLREYAGCYNYRLMRGGSAYSLHAYGAAIDLTPDDNAFRDSWPLRASMPIGVMEAFAREGWLAAGAFWGYDAMHFQATR